MANTREKIEKELMVQKEIEGFEDNNEEILRTFLKICKSNMQWNVFTEVRFHRHGKYSYECDRFYYPSDELVNFYNILKEKEQDKDGEPEVGEHKVRTHKVSESE